MSLLEVMWVPLTVILWIALIFILLNNALKAQKENRIVYSIFLLVATILLIVLTGQFIVFIVWAYGCSLGIPIGCIK